MPETTTLDSHVAVLAFPFSSHAAALLAIVRSLAASAPNTNFSFFSTAQSNNSIFSTSKHVHLSNLKAYNVSDGVPEGYVFAGKHQEDIELFMKAAPDSFRKGIEEAEVEVGRKVSCLVVDAFFWFAVHMAEEMAVPWIAFWAGEAISLSAHVYTDLIRETVAAGGNIVGRDDETLKFIPGMSNIRISDLPEGILFGNLESLFSRMLHQMGQVLPQAAAVFLNSFVEIDPITTNDLKSKLKNFLNIGPLNLLTPTPPAPDTNSCLPWLDKQKPTSVAYVSFGTVATPPPSELAALAEALETSKVPFLWSMRDNHKANLPKGFSEKVKDHGLIVSWAPQLDVLTHSAVGVFVTHCGWSSLLESIAGGVPMLCRPFFGDQRLNGRMIDDVWGIGVKVEGGIFTKNGLINGLNVILAQEKGKKMREKLRELKELAQRAVAPNGSSTQNLKTLLNLTCGHK